MRMLKLDDTPGAVPVIFHSSYSGGKLLCKQFVPICNSYLIAFLVEIEVQCWNHSFLYISVIHLVDTRHGL